MYFGIHLLQLSVSSHRMALTGACVASLHQIIINRYWRTLDKSRRVCYYAGGGQGEPSGELASADDSIIEGNYTNYFMDF